MNEEIRKNAEINDDELEQVAGGGCYDDVAPNCPYCGVKMTHPYGTIPVFSCSGCRFEAEYDFDTGTFSTSPSGMP